MEKIKVSLISDRKREIYVFYHTLFISSENEKCFRQKLYRNSKHSFAQSLFFENLVVYKKIWKNIVERGRPHDNMAHALCMLDT